MLHLICESGGLCKGRQPENGGIRVSGCFFGKNRVRRGATHPTQATLAASDTAKLTGVSIRSVNSLYLKLRRRLADECGRQASLYGIV